jgi:hypothetical protein
MGTYKSVDHFGDIQVLSDKILSALATETGTVNKIPKETHVLGYRCSKLIL